MGTMVLKDSVKKNDSQAIENTIAKGFLSKEEAEEKRKELYASLTSEDKTRMKPYLENGESKKKKSKMEKGKKRQGSLYKKRKLEILETKRVENAILAADAEMILQTEA